MEPYLIKHLSPLLGRKITGLIEDNSDKTTDPFPGFRLDNGTLVFVSCDPEGNGPGHLMIEPGTAKVANMRITQRPDGWWLLVESKGQSAAFNLGQNHGPILEGVLKRVNEQEMS